MDNQEKLMKLEKLLIDINKSEFAKLTKVGFNMFDVLKISRTEIRHSNVLAWLLDPRESHGFGKKILSNLNSHIVENKLCESNKVFDILMMDYSDVVVYREWKNIDILIISKKEKYIICIENKIDSQDHDNQLDKYYETLNKNFPDYSKAFLYLTPDGVSPQNDKYEVWGCISYETVIDIIERELSELHTDSDLYRFIKSYLEILRREIMKDIEVVALCQKIYKEHKEALDLIFENRPDKLLELSEFLRAWCRKMNDEGKIIFVEKKSSKSYMRFRTQKMDEFLPKTPGKLSGWGTENHYFYEISSYWDNNGKLVSNMQLSFSSTNLDSENLKRYEDIINKRCKGNLKPNWQWKTVFKAEDALNFEQDDVFPENPQIDNDIFKALDKMFDQICDEEEKLIKLMEE